MSTLRAKPQKAAQQEVWMTLNDDIAREMEAEYTPEIIVAVRSGNILATAFHPELTADDRWHKYFLKMVTDANGDTSSTGDEVGL